MNHVWSAPLFGRSTCFFLNYCILTWRNIIFCHETPGKIRRIGIAYHIHYSDTVNLPCNKSVAALIILTRRIRLTGVTPVNCLIFRYNSFRFIPNS